MTFRELCGGVVVVVALSTILPAAMAFEAVTASRAAFSSTTDGVRAISVGAVTLGDDDSGWAMFNRPLLKPGDPVEDCIVVTYSGTVTPADLSLYGAVAGTGLDPYLDLRIEVGSGGGFGDCTDFTSSGILFSGTLASFAATHANFTDGIRVGPVSTTPQSRTYRFTLTLRDDNAAQGKSASATFTWEAQNR